MFDELTRLSFESIFLKEFICLPLSSVDPKFSIKGIDDDAFDAPQSDLSSSDSFDILKLT